MTVFAMWWLAQERLKADVRAMEQARLLTAAQAARRLRAAESAHVRQAPAGRRDARRVLLRRLLGEAATA